MGVNGDSRNSQLSVRSSEYAARARNANSGGKPVKIYQVAEVVELVDTLDLKSNGHYVRAGSSPAFSTEKARTIVLAFCFYTHLDFYQYNLLLQWRF